MRTQTNNQPLKRLLEDIETKRSLDGRQMAAVLGISPTMYSSIKHGRRKPAWTIVDTLAKVFGTNPEDAYYAVAIAREEVTLDLRSLPPQERIIAIHLATAISQGTLSKSAKIELRQILQTHKDKE